MTGTTIPAAVITVSDRCARGEAQDQSGPLAVELLGAHGCAARLSVIPDGADGVEAAIRAALDGGARVVLTTGGTGVGPRDQTPEGTARVLEKHLPGVPAAIRSAGGSAADGFGPALLSRGLAGVAGTTLIVNAPGSPAGVRDAIGVVGPLIGHVLDQLDGGHHG